MERKTLIIAVIALAVGALGGYASGSEFREIEGVHRMPDGSVMHDSGMQGAMGDMMRGLEGKNGSDFDAAFLSEMIMHHEGAVLMAQAALASSTRPEIRTMAEAIISAQTEEIAQMKRWQHEWHMAQ